VAASHFDRALAMMLGASAAMLWFSGFLGLVGILGWQVFKYLKAGEWVPITAIHVIWKLTGEDPYGWAAFPDSWYGVHSILAATPGALFVALCLWGTALLLAGWIAALDN
jgi:hypothetical protein